MSLICHRGSAIGILSSSSLDVEVLEEISLIWKSPSSRITTHQAQSPIAFCNLVVNLTCGKTLTFDDASAMVVGVTLTSTQKLDDLFPFTTQDESKEHR